MAAMNQKGPRKAGLSGLLGSALRARAWLKLPRLEAHKRFCLLASPPADPSEAHKGRPTHPDGGHDSPINGETLLRPPYPHSGIIRTKHNAP